MVSLRSSKAKTRKVIIDESSSEQSAHEESDNLENKKNKKTKAVTATTTKLIRGRKKKSSKDESEDDLDEHIDDDEDVDNEDNEEEEDEANKDKNKKGQAANKRQLKKEQIDASIDIEENDNATSKRGRNKSAASNKQPTKQLTLATAFAKRGRPAKEKKIQEEEEEQEEDDYNPSHSEEGKDEEEEDDFDEDEEDNEEKANKKKRGGKAQNEKKNTKKGKPNKADEAQKDDNNKGNEGENSQIKEKGKRGYKRCKNDSCSQLIFIHQKVCPHCSHEHKMSVQTLEKKQKDKKEKSLNTFEVLKAFIQTNEGNKKVKIRKKDQLPIQQIKKNALYLDEFNLDQENLKQMFEEEKVPLFTYPYDEQIRNSDAEDQIHIKGSKPSKKLKKEESKQNPSESQSQGTNNKKLEGEQKTVEILRNNKFDVQVQINFNEKQEVIDIPQFGHFSVFNQPSEKQNEQNQQQSASSQSKITAFIKGGKDKTKASQQNSSKSSSNESQQQQKGDWRFFLMNIGYPVTCVGWSYTNVESEHKDQYLAVGVNVNQVTQESEKIEIFRTMQAYDLLGCHRVGQKYESENCILIFQIPFDKQAHAYKEPVLVKNISITGTPLSIKWMPKYTKRETTSFAVLTSSGAILFYSFNLEESQQQPFPNNADSSSNKSNKNQQHSSNNSQQNALFRFSEKQTPLMKLAINSDVILSCFDWLNNESCNYIVAGDQVGNIYLVEIIGKETGFKMAQYYNNAHMGQVIDVKFYPQSNQTDQIIFASCGYDGLVKIFDVFDQSFPIFIYESCLKSCKSLAWDIGGKYLLVNRDKQQFSQIILSFFSTSISKKVELNNFVEARQLQKINQDNVVTMSSSSIFSQYIFSSNEVGKVFGNFTEQNRRISVKKIKKKSSECEGFEICSGSFLDSRNGANNPQQKRIYNLSLSDVSSFFLSNSEEGENQKDQDDEIEEEENKNTKKSKSKTRIEFQSIDNRAYITCLEMSQSNILSLEIKTTEKSTNEDQTSTYTLESFLAFCNYGGILHISKVYA